MQLKDVKTVFMYVYLLDNFYPLSAELSNLNLYPLEVVFRYNDPQLQVARIYLHK